MKNSLKKTELLVKSFFIRYVIGLILCSKNRVCTAIAKIFGISHDSIYRYLSKNRELLVLLPDFLMRLACHYQNIKEGWLIMDDSVLSKIHAKMIEGIHFVYNSSLRKPERGLCIVVLAWTNEDVTIPIAFDWWFSKRIMPDNHQTKIEIAQRLIEEAIAKIRFKRILFDAAYCSVKMINFLQDHGIDFVSRIHSNRKVASADGTCEQLKKHPLLKLKKNTQSKVFNVTFRGMQVNIVVWKRKKKIDREYETIFLISSINGKAKDILEMYGIRWNIEVMFRTMKQALGLMQCSARALAKQSSHVLAVFLAFSFLQHEKTKTNATCSEDVIRKLQDQKIEESIDSFSSFCRNFYNVA